MTRKWLLEQSLLQSESDLLFIESHLPVIGFPKLCESCEGRVHMKEPSSVPDSVHLLQMLITTLNRTET